jgi:outer membrane protein OmpA-like peptidoglycan-associated protein
MKMFKNSVVLAAMLLLSSSALALDITPTDDATTLANGVVVGGGVTIDSVAYVGNEAASGIYTDGPLGIADGSILTSGSAVNALPPNDDDGISSSWSLPGDPLCDQLVGEGVDTGDAARLEITFTVAEGFQGIRFEYIVGSDEYPEFVGEFNDAVGIFVDGTNQALDAEGNAITINGAFFSGDEVVTDNGTEYDGSTPRLQRGVVLEPGQHTMIVVVCDALDTAFDTGIFIAGLAGCTGDCDSNSWCGDGNVDDGEDCDDGNNADGDGCDNTCKLEAVCGDGQCFVDESCETCAQDCGECPPECGDGECNGDETCETCEGDCGACPDPECGDGECNGDETCETCVDDCGECAAECGDGECNGDETCETCEGDCGDCAAECGDGECNGDETCETCIDDCGECAAECGDGECNGDETCETCVDDCGECAAECGDGECNGDETCESCEADCGACAAPECGDGECNGDETCESCEADCGACAAPECGDGICNGEENCDSCPGDCGDCPDGYGGECDSCPDATCESDVVDYSGVMVSGGPGGCTATPTSGSSAGLIFLLVALLGLVALRFRRFAWGLSLLVLLVATPAMALDITASDDAETLAAAVVVGSGVTIDGATYTGNEEASGTYTDGPLGIKDGSILTSGAATNALPPNDTDSATSDWQGAGDPLCDALIGSNTSTGDAAKLEITFTVAEGYKGIRFEYIVGSEEYPDYVGGDYNDGVGVFVNGANQALDLDGNPITINGPFFAGDAVVEDNGTQYNGSTPRLQRGVALEPGQHTMIIVVCDAGDTAYDTGILLAGIVGCTENCEGNSWCGDGTVDDGEDCDDGNNVDGDGCDNTCKLEAVCGDGECFVDESCETCAQDCGECVPECGDGECTDDEGCTDCPADCGECAAECGDGECNGDETCETCEGDCGECAAECGDGVCGDDEGCTDCPADCGECAAAECGDGECNGDETCETCDADCGECVVGCGDGVCGDDEDCLTCADDCGTCPPKCETCEDPACETTDDVEVTGGVDSNCSASPNGPATPLVFVLFALLALAVWGLRWRPFRSLLVLALVASTLTLAGPGVAHAQGAQDVQIESQFFKPTPFIGDCFTVGDGKTMGKCKWNVGLMLNYQNDPLVLRTTDGDEIGALVEHQLVGNLLAAYKVLDWLAIGLDVPITLLQLGDDITGFPEAGVAGIGDIRLVPRARLYQTADGFFTLGAELIISFPTGQLVDNYMGRSGFGIMPRLLAGLDFGRGGLALNLGTLIATGEDTALNVETGHALDTRLGGWFGIVPEKLDVIAEVASQMKLTEPFADMENNPVEATGGLRYHVGNGLIVNFGGGAGITEGAAAPDFRVFAGVQYASCGEPPPPPAPPVCDPDPDGDKICSACVSDQGREKEFASVCTGKDQCPEVPEDMDKFEDLDGCPDPDNDKDGVCDPWVAKQGLEKKYKGTCKGKDQCPMDPEDKDGFEDEDGCPEPDNDNDQFCESWVAEKGLEAKYKDVCKPTDKCPNEPETKNSYQDDDGCPDKAVVVEKKQILILQKVEFYLDETRIKEESYPLLDEVVQTLKDNPQILKVRIEGHTDSRASDSYNKKLSTGRVKTVEKYLVDHGIDGGRLTSKGYGESKLLIKNAKTEEEHQRNRRVEFIIIKLAK